MLNNSRENQVFIEDNIFQSLRSLFRRHTLLETLPPLNQPFMYQGLFHNLLVRLHTISWRNLWSFLRLQKQDFFKSKRRISLKKNQIQIMFFEKFLICQSEKSKDKRRWAKMSESIFLLFFICIYFFGGGVKNAIAVSFCSGSPARLGSQLKGRCDIQYGKYILRAIGTLIGQASTGFFFKPR